MWNGRVMKSGLLAVLCSILAVTKTCQRELLFPGTNHISHLTHFKGMRQAPEVRKSQEMVPGPAAPPLPHLQHPWCITATTTDYLSFGSLPPLLGRMNNTAWKSSCSIFIFICRVQHVALTGCTTQRRNSVLPGFCSKCSRGAAAPFARCALAHAVCWRR